MNLLALLWIYMFNYCPGWALGATEGVRVVQTPRTLLVTEGGTANLTCYYSPEGVEDYAINWFHQSNNQSNQDEAIVYMDKLMANQSIRLVHTLDRERNISQLSISDLQLGDGGTYYCEFLALSQPFIKVLWGNGSRLTVTERDRYKNPFLYQLLCIPLILCVIFLAVVFNKKMKQKEKVEYSSPPTRTIPEDTSRSGTTIYATLFSARNGEDPQDLEVVNSDLFVERKATNVSTGEVEYSTVNSRKPEGKTESGHEEQMVYSQLQFKQSEAQMR
ncbi:uncharacterized protein LOC109927700 [Rhincodon typus]|uniref:uncharacterized protein LOC109927700 n=1 Tax=Rhincodon typus TaxID=259920 RepID=UPI0009A29B87|nr:uncharacterized protein LOC109927700 [Rhincodon typus]